MLFLECDHIPEKYPEILQLVIEKGRMVEPRGEKCLEISPLCITSSYSRKRLFGTPERNENPIFAYIEALWFLKGDDTPDMPAHYVRQTRCYVNPVTGRFDGAYGPRLTNYSGINQLDAVYNRLIKDRDTRRAMITIFDPRRDNNEDSLDIPCTIAFQFMIRNEKLDMITYMRSNDLFRGFVYDTVEFQWFQEILAGWLGVDVGRYVHMVGSAHIYLRDKPKVQRIISACESFNEPFTLYRTCSPQDATLSRRDFEAEIRRLFAIEEASRKGRLLNRNEAEEIVNTFMCRFYRNLALAIVGFNARKFGNEHLATAAFSQVDNELGPLLSRRLTPRYKQSSKSCDSYFKALSGEMPFRTPKASFAM